MPSRGEQMVRAHGPKTFQANLPVVNPDLLLSQIYDLISRDLNADTGGKLWDIDKEKRFLPDNPDGKYITAQGKYKIAKSVGILQLNATSVRYGKLGTTLVMTFQDNWGWLPSAEHIVSSVMRDTDQLVKRYYGQRRWVMLSGSWLCFQGFATSSELDPPEPDNESPPDDPDEDVSPPFLPMRRGSIQGAPNPALVKRIRQAFATRKRIREVVQAVDEAFDRPTRPDWSGKWNWSASGTSVKTVFTRKLQRRAEAKPLSPEGEMLLRSRVGSPEGAKLDTQYRYALTAEIDMQEDGATNVQITVEETIDPDNHHNHSAVRPASYLSELNQLLSELRLKLTKSA